MVTLLWSFLCNLCLVLAIVYDDQVNRESSVLEITWDDCVVALHLPSYHLKTVGIYISRLYRLEIILTQDQKSPRFWVSSEAKFQVNVDVWNANASYNFLVLCFLATTIAIDWT